MPQIMKSQSEVINKVVRDKVRLNRGKLPNVETTIFGVMSSLANEHKAINLSQGMPDFGPDPFFTERLEYHSRMGQNQYAPSMGVLSLREEIGHLIKNKYGLQVCPVEEITVTSGATEGVFVALQALVMAGDEVIVFDPVFDSYEPGINMAGGKAIHIAMKMDQDDRHYIDWNEVESKVTPKTKAILVNTPHNPTGTVFTEEDFLNLQRIVLENELWCISDEVYEHMTYDGVPALSVHCFPELATRSYGVSSFGKTFSLTGWKIGYAVAPIALTNEFRKIHQYVLFCSHAPSQHVLSDGLREKQEIITELKTVYQQKRDLFRDALKGSRFKLLPCSGTFFQCADYSAISSMDDVEFCKWMTKEHKVAAVPLSVLYESSPQNAKVIRFCFAKDSATLKEAAARLCKM
eukprot:GHVN01067350.1.p1 GENE.GHVN01067350.1~~GHVN01067350.1.p1  ORF type:complete len:406 (+),score=55.64 GHVN01067350.1:134-1351(+)